jgi:anti-anti-sigma factor
MEISLTEAEGYQLLSVSGRLDASSAPLLQARFEAALAPGKCSFVLDLHGVDYVSSGGLRVLLIMTKKVRSAGGGIVLAQLHPFVEDLMRMSGFQSLIAQAPSNEEAARLLASGGLP